MEAKTQHFVNWVHTQRGAYPKNIFSDGGGEYITLNLRAFCDQLGINLKHTAPYSPQMNAIAERINRTIEEGATSMLLRSGLDREFWEEAVNHFVFIKNHTPHSKLDGGRPIDVWGEELNEKEGKGLWSIKPLGCSAWYHIPKEARPKGLEHIRSNCMLFIWVFTHINRLTFSMTIRKTKLSQATVNTTIHRFFHWQIRRPREHLLLAQVLLVVTWEQGEQV